jgi:hypothetical protein
MTMTGVRLMAVAVGWAIASAAPVRAEDKTSSTIDVGAAGPRDSSDAARGARTTPIGPSVEQTTSNVEISRPASITTVSSAAVPVPATIPSVPTPAAPATTTTYGAGAAPAAPMTPTTAPSVGSSIPSSLITGSSSMHF